MNPDEMPKNVILTDFPDDKNDSGIIAHGPTIKEPGLMHIRLVLRHIGNGYVVHSQGWHQAAATEPCEFFHGDYFNYSANDEADKLNAFLKANDCFRKRLKKQLEGIRPYVCA